ncbi:hypothetical protein, partial [Pseudomonas veronii]
YVLNSGLEKFRLALAGKQMDIENFNHCLSYILLAQNNKPTIELLLPASNYSDWHFIGFRFHII